MKSLKYLILLFPILVFGQPQNIPWSNFTGTFSGGGTCILTKDTQSGIVSITFNCSFAPTIITNHSVATVSLPPMTIGYIPNGQTATPCLLYVDGNGQLMISSNSTAVSAFNGTLNCAYTYPGNPYYTAVSSGENYVKTTEYLTDQESGDKRINTTYYDGLGRPKQSIQNGQLGVGISMITPISYDIYGRQAKEYLSYPAPTTTAQYYVSATSDVLNYSLYVGQYPYSEKAYEPSPLNRILKQSAPGTDWSMGSGHEIKFDYKTNTANEVKFFKAATNSSYGISLTNFSGTVFYNANELYKTITYDENSAINPLESNGSIIEYKNKEGQLVLKRTYSTVGTGTTNVALDTYYVYDNFGNLTYVIPPKADNSVTPQVLDDLCYQYKYDYNNRLIEKKLPGKQWEFMVYDKLNRIVMTGPAFSPFQDNPNVGWNITKYDGFDRQVYTGWYSGHQADSANRIALQVIQDSPLTVVNESRGTAIQINYVSVAYTNNTEPKTAFNVLTVNYYDDYTFPNAAPLVSPVETQSILTNVKTLPTGTWVRALTSEGEFNGESTTFFYDSKARIISKYAKNYLGGFTQVKLNLDFTGKTIYTVTTHNRSLTASPSITIKEAFTYDALDNVTSHTHQINGGDIVRLAQNTYNSVAQLASKKVGNLYSNPSPLQNVHYTYNMRGWLTDINKTGGDPTVDPTPLSQGGDPTDLFAFKINYNTTEGNVAGIVPLYNGNISETYWRTSNDNICRKYGYQYDNANKLRNAVYQKPYTSQPNSYGESMNYDKNGNIMALSRTGEYDDTVYTLTTDDLVYSYGVNNDNSTNQLFKVVDNSNNPNGFQDSAANTVNDFAYDANGNMTADANKRITSVIYNHLNLPLKIIFNNLQTQKIDYIYDAAGVKLKKIVTQPTEVGSVDYLSGFQYSNGVLDFLPTGEGYVKNTVVAGNNVYSYVFNYTDHLGNVRVSYGRDENNNLRILDENNYYPFGLIHKNYNLSKFIYTKIGGAVGLLPGVSGYKHKFNGKELQDELGLNVYDYGARMYMPDVARWGSTDGKAELYFGTSPYVYAKNTPIQAIDPDGNLVIFINGMHSGSGGTAKYWRGYKSEGYVSDTGSFLGIGWERHSTRTWETGSFDNTVMNQLNDHNPMYVDGAMGGTKGLMSISTFGSFNSNIPAENRINAGHEQGKKDAEKIIANLAKDETTGEIVETIKIITHSMGSAYGKGYVKALQEYIKTLPKALQYQIKIILVGDFDPYQAASLSANSSVFTQQFTHIDDSISGVADQRQDGLNDSNYFEQKGAHAVMSFLSDISKLQEGIYSWNGSSWTCTNCK
jgi:RHS repeat-associated protein